MDKNKKNNFINENNLATPPLQYNKFKTHQMKGTERERVCVLTSKHGLERMKSVK